MQLAIVEDHLLLAESLGNSLSNALENCNIKLFDSAESFFAHHFNDWMPDVVLVDIMLKSMGGIEMIEKIMTTMHVAKQCRFILVSSITDIYTVKNGIRKGAKGYLTKNASLEEMQEAVLTVYGGGQYISKLLRDKLVSNMFTEDTVVMHLSPKEQAVLQLICQGLTRKEIAYDMKLSIHTVQQYNKSLMKKFKVSGIAELVVFAIQKGLYNPDKG